MTNSIYLTTIEPHGGKSLISLGVLSAALRTTGRVGVFRPVIRDGVDGRRDKNIDLLLAHFKLSQPYQDTYAFTISEATDLLAQQQHDDFLRRIIQKYSTLSERYDFLLCIGSDLTDEGATFEFDINIEIAQSLGSWVLILASGAGNNYDEIISPIRMALERFQAKNCPILGVIVNRADPQHTDELQRKLQQDLNLDDLIVSVIPTDERLASPTLKEIAEHLNAEVLYGADKLDRLAQHYMVIAMQMQNYLARLKGKENALLLTPGDRGEVILSAILAHRSKNYPAVAGLLLTTGERPASTITQLLDGLNQVPPILAVETETYESVTNINAIRSYITADNLAKIKASLRLFAKHVDTEAMIERYGHLEPRGLSPQMFLFNLTQQAKANKKRIAFPEGVDDRILKAAESLLEQDVVDITLIGNPNEIKSIIARRGFHIDLDSVDIVQPHTAPQFEDYAQTYYQLRKHRGITIDFARDQMNDVSYFGTMMVYKGDADGMVSGAMHTTAHTITPAFQFIKTKAGYSVVSSVFFMCLEDRVLVYGDCAVNPKPTAPQLAEIAVTSAETALTFGIEPRVAMLSYSSGASGRGQEVERVREATKLAQQRRPDLLIEGPIQYDAAVDEAIGKSKMPGSEVAGRASVLIFPDLNTGNNTYKAVQRETGAIAVGPVLQGLNKPVNDLSRGCTVDDIINTVAITAIQAQQA